MPDDIDFILDEAEANSLTEPEPEPRAGFQEMADLARARGFTAASASWKHIGVPGRLVGYAECRNPDTDSTITTVEATPEAAIEALSWLLGAKTYLGALALPFTEVGEVVQSLGAVLVDRGYDRHQVIHQLRDGATHGWWNEDTFWEFTLGPAVDKMVELLDLEMPEDDE